MDKLEIESISSFWKQLLCIYPRFEALSVFVFFFVRNFFNYVILFISEDIQACMFFLFVGNDLILSLYHMAFVTMMQAMVCSVT
jgi:hypothetical protein